MKRRMIAGYWIEAVTASPLPHITIERLGAKERGYLTPEEARKLAESLIRAADAAEAS
jgi:hypothetical protein